MPPINPNNPEQIELMDFLIEKTRDAKSPLSITKLAEEYKETSGFSRKIFYLRMRIGSFRARIHQMDSIDTETKLKMLFALSAPIDEAFLDELRKDAVIKVDEKNRIITYRANDGSLELEGDHSQPAKKMTPPINRNNSEQIEDFLIEKTKDAKSSLNITKLAEEYKEMSGSSQKLSYLRMRIGLFRSRIHRMDSIDTAEKVRMLFALGGSVDMDFLNELRKDAHVEVDEKNRITKYRANDGSLELTGDHNQSGFQGSILKTLGSTKRAAAAEEPKSSKKTKLGVVKSEDYIPDDIEDSQSSTAPNAGNQHPKIEYSEHSSGENGECSSNHT